MSVSTIYNWKGQFPEFLEAIRGAKAVADCLVAEKLFEKATGYEWVEEQAIKVRTIVYGDNGKKLKETEEVRVVEVRKRLPPDTTAAIFWLKNRQPEVWGDNRKPPAPEDSLVNDEAIRQHYAKMAERYDRGAKPAEGEAKPGEGEAKPAEGEKVH